MAENNHDEVTVWNNTFNKLKNLPIVKAAKKAGDAIQANAKNLVKNMLDICRGLVVIRETFSGDNHYALAVEQLGLKGKIEKWSSDALAVFQNMENHPEKITREKVSDLVDQMVLSGSTNFKKLIVDYKTFALTRGNSKYARAGWLGARGGDAKPIKKSNVVTSTIKSSATPEEFMVFAKHAVKKEFPAWTETEIRKLAVFFPMFLEEIKAADKAA